MVETPPPSDDSRRFEAHLTPLLGAAYGTALHLTRNSHDAEDLVQDAAFLAFRAFHQFAEGTRFKAWFFRILMNRFYEKYRKSKREPDTVEYDDAPALYLFDQSERTGLTARFEDPAAYILSRLTTEQVAAAIAALPDDFRDVAALYFMGDFGYQEIADMLGIPIGTVRSRLHRGRRLLQVALWALAEENGIVAGDPAPAQPMEDR